MNVDTAKEVNRATNREEAKETIEEVANMYVVSTDAKLFDVCRGPMVVVYQAVRLDTGWNGRCWSEGAKMGVCQQSVTAYLRICSVLS